MLLSLLVAVVFLLSICGQSLVCADDRNHRLGTGFRVRQLVASKNDSSSSVITPLNATASSCSYAATCSVGGYSGSCVSISGGCCVGGKATSGLCPGSSDIQCCTQASCSTPSGAGTCMQTSLCSSKGMTSVSGYCVGPSDLQCCIDGTVAVDDALTPANSGIYYTNWCGGELKYLDDKYCVKQFPSKFDRDQTCPAAVLSAAPAGYYPDGPLSNIPVDTTALSNIVTNGANLCMILTKRVGQSDGRIKLFNKYFCAGEKSHTESYETWSSSKIFAIANAGGHLRINEKSCAVDVFGIDGSTSGKDGKTPLGDLATIVCSYDHTKGYSSNSLSSYFHDIGFRDRIHGLVQNSTWIGLSGLSLGGNYGEATPSDLSLNLKDGPGTLQCSADKDPWPTVYSNSLSALAAAEMARRIALHREVDEKFRFPGSEWLDIQNELYGAETSLLFPDLKWGGMSTDTAVYVQSSLNMTDVERKSQGKWRIFSKLGAGYSSSRLVGEIINTAHICMPDIENPENGLEFTISARGSISHDTSLVSTDNLVYTAMQAAISAVVSGQIK